VVGHSYKAQVGPSALSDFATGPETAFEENDRDVSPNPTSWGRYPFSESAIRSVVESGGFSDIFVLRSSEFLGESDEKPFRPADVAEPIRFFILDYFAYELCAALAELFKRLVDVVHGEHDAEVA